MNWYLVSTRPNKRDLFLKELNFEIEKHQLREIFQDMISPKDKMYKDMILIEVIDFQRARSYLSNIEHFQRIEPRALSEKQVRQFLAT